MEKNPKDFKRKLAEEHERIEKEVEVVIKALKEGKTLNQIPASSIAKEMALSRISLIECRNQTGKNSTQIQEDDLSK